MNHIESDDLLARCAPYRATLLVLLLTGCGAGSGEGLDASGQPIGAGGGIPLAPTLASIQVNVFTPSCAIAGCHSGATAAQGLRLDPGFSADSLIGVASPRNASLVRVVPADPNNSFLIQKLEGTQRLGDRMPLGGPFLPQADINVIRQWIANGALR